MIQIKNISLSYGEQKLFDEISCSIKSNERIGLVGRNGTGKSTLLKSMVKPSLLEDGTISMPKNYRIAYMPQEMVLSSSKSILDETLTALDRIQELQKQIIFLEKSVNQDPTDTKAIDQLVAAHEELIELNPEKSEQKAIDVLIGLGFASNNLSKPVNELSVGWKMRIVLAKLLLQSADFYLFDEPTNHLDLMAKNWFIQFLKNASFGFMLVCHERYIMQELCDSIFELELGKGKKYHQRYHAYEEQKKHDYEILKQRQKLQEKDIKNKQKTIDRFRASASKSKMAKSMERALDKVERIVLPPDPKTIHFSIPEPTRSGKIVLELSKVSHSFNAQATDSAPHKLFENVNLEIKRQERVALIAPNGVGKTTLFNLITNRIPLQSGKITMGYKVEPALFHQDQHTIFSARNSIFENVVNKVKHKKESEIRAMLGCFLFEKEDINKKFGVLSGGEKNRVAMATVLLQDANFLLLDEPTNHLDIHAKDVLLQALKSFQGTIFFVSHDHDFIHHLATHIIELKPTGIFDWHGNYESLKQSTTQPTLDAATKKNKKTSEPKQKNNSQDHRLQKKKLNSIEKTIEKMEKAIKKQSDLFKNLQWNDPEYQIQHKKLQDLQHDLVNAHKEWETIMQHLII